MIVLLIMLTIASIAGSIFVFIKRNQTKNAGLEYNKIQAIGFGLLFLAIVMGFSAFLISRDSVVPDSNPMVVDDTTLAASYNASLESITSVAPDDLFANTVPVELSPYCIISIPSAWDNDNYSIRKDGIIELYPNTVNKNDVKIEIQTIRYEEPFEVLMDMFVNEETILRSKANIGGGLTAARIFQGTSKKIIEQFSYNWKTGSHIYSALTVYFPQSPVDATRFTLVMENGKVDVSDADIYLDMLKKITGSAKMEFSYTQEDIDVCLVADEKRKNSVANNSATPAESSENKAHDTDTEIQSETGSSVTSKESSDSEKNTYKEDIRGHIIVNYSGTSVDSITINDDYGTDAEDDYIALVNLTWTVKNNGQMSKKVLKMYSEDLAATVAIECPNIQEIAIFWTVPYLNANAKCSYERKGNGMYEMDMYWDTAFDK